MSPMNSLGLTDPTWMLEPNKRSHFPSLALSHSQDAERMPCWLLHNCGTPSLRQIARLEHVLDLRIQLEQCTKTHKTKCLRVSSHAKSQLFKANPGFGRFVRERDFSS